MSDIEARPGKLVDFAPYPVWFSLRIVTMIGAGLILTWFGWMIYALFEAIEGNGVELLPMWSLVLGLILGSQPRHWSLKKGRNLPPFGELLGRALADKLCGNCGQSIFDHTPPTGYEPDVEKTKWWPVKACENCGQSFMRAFHK